MLGFWGAKMMISKGENSAAGEKFWPKYLAESRNPPLVPGQNDHKGGFLAPVGTDSEFFLEIKSYVDRRSINIEL